MLLSRPPSVALGRLDCSSRRLTIVIRSLRHQGRPCVSTSQLSAGVQSESPLPPACEAILEHAVSLSLSATRAISWRRPRAHRGAYEDCFLSPRISHSQTLAFRSLSASTQRWRLMDNPPRSTFKRADNFSSFLQLPHPCSNVTLTSK